MPLCHRLGLPVAPEKIEGPATSLTFLGINVDSNEMSMSLSKERPMALKQQLSSWLNRRFASKHQLQELLNHAAAVVRPSSGP